MTDTKSEARNYRQWYLRDNFYARNVLHPVGDIFGTQLDVHAIEIKAYTDLLAKHERVLQALKEASKRSTYEWTDGYDYFPSDHANEGRIALANELLKILGTP